MAEDKTTAPEETMTAPDTTPVAAAAPAPEAPVATAAPPAAAPHRRPGFLAGLAVGVAATLVVLAAGRFAFGLARMVVRGPDWRGRGAIERSYMGGRGWSDDGNGPGGGRMAPGLRGRGIQGHRGGFQSPSQTTTATP